MSKWTRFMDMHSGGGAKEKFDKILIEAPENEAVVIFYNRFGHNPNRVTCTCCGSDYSIDESDSLEKATAYDRHCRYWEGKSIEIDDPNWAAALNKKWGDIGKYIPLDVYIIQPNVLVIRSVDIKDEERAGTVPEQGYVWQD